MKKLLLFAAIISAAFTASARSWAPAGDNIMTPWAEDVDPSCPRGEYPRPQMVRNSWLNLNGLRDYGITDASEDRFASEGNILVPFAIESSLSCVTARSLIRSTDILH